MTDNIPVKEILDEISIFQNNLFESVQQEKTAEVKKLLEQDLDITFEENLVFRTAIESRKYEIVELLMNDKRINPSKHHNISLHLAAIDGQQDIVNLLLTDKRVLDGGGFLSIIKDAYLQDNYHILDILWNNNIIKNSTKDNIKKLDENLNLKNSLYDYLIKLDIKNKIKTF
jgi:hypothetical protein